MPNDSTIGSKIGTVTMSIEIVSMNIPRKRKNTTTINKNMDLLNPVCWINFASAGIKPATVKYLLNNIPPTTMTNNTKAEEILIRSNICGPLF